MQIVYLEQSSSTLSFFPTSVYFFRALYKLENKAGRAWVEAN